MREKENKLDIETSVRQTLCITIQRNGEQGMESRQHMPNSNCLSREEQRWGAAQTGTDGHLTAQMLQKLSRASKGHQEGLKLLSRKTVCKFST